MVKRKKPGARKAARKAAPAAKRKAQRTAKKAARKAAPAERKATPARKAPPSSSRTVTKSKASENDNLYAKKASGLAGKSTGQIKKRIAKRTEAGKPAKRAKAELARRKEGPKKQPPRAPSPTPYRGKPSKDSGDNKDYPGGSKFFNESTGKYKGKAPSNSGPMKKKQVKRAARRTKKMFGKK